MSAGLLGTFPAGLTTGFQNIGAVQLFRAAKGSLGVFPGGLTTGYLTIGAVEKVQSNQYVNSFSDAVTSADSVSATMTASASINDSVTGSDTQNVSAGYLQSFSDSVTGADTISASMAGATSFSDAVTSADTMGAVMVTSASFSDSVTATDSFLGGIGYMFSFSDSVAASDSILSTASYANTFSDAITATDSIIGGIGYFNTFSDSVVASDFVLTTPQANIILSGTLDFGYSFRIRHQISTFLNFGIIIGDDNLIEVTVTNIITSAPVLLASAVINFYAPNTSSNPVITKTGSIGSGNFQFAITSMDTLSLVVGRYSWVATVTLPDTTIHTVNCGDINLSTGIMRVFERP